MNTLDIQFNSNSRNFKVMTRPQLKLQDENWSIGKVENFPSLTWRDSSKTSTLTLLETWPDHLKDKDKDKDKDKVEILLLSQRDGLKTSTRASLVTWLNQLNDNDKWKWQMQIQIQIHGQIQRQRQSGKVCSSHMERWFKKANSALLKKSPNQLKDKDKAKT